MLPELSELFTRDLNKAMAELDLYPTEASLWLVGEQISNSAGNLALHLAGNLRLLLGDDLGGVPYARDREAEFGSRNVPRAEVQDGLRRTLEVVQSTLAALDESRLDEPNPRQLPGFPDGMSTRYFLLHLYGHLNYHLGQINYHRRLLAAGDGPA
jgi:hypothetical protein